MDLATGNLVEEGMAVGIIAAQSIGEPGTQLTMRSFDIGGTVERIQDITGGLPRVTEIFEARQPREPAVMAEVAGKVRLGEKRRGKRSILIQVVDEQGRPTGEEKEHLVPHGKHLRVHGNDHIKEGDLLVDGPLVPHDILRISGPEAVQNYLVREVQSVYRSQRVDIDDKHVEIIISQMLRKVKVETMGDTGLLPGSVIDKFAFFEVNNRLRECVKVKDPGDSKFEPGKIVSKEAFEEERARLEAEGKRPPGFAPPTTATGSTQLLGISMAAINSDSFISAASFQETTKVLTEAALAGKVDYLVGLKENVILGHLVPAGTGFHSHQEAEVRINPQALEGLLPAPAKPPPPAAELEPAELIEDFRRTTGGRSSHQQPQATPIRPRTTGPGVSVPKTTPSTSLAQTEIAARAHPGELSAGVASPPKGLHAPGNITPPGDSGVISPSTKKPQTPSLPLHGSRPSVIEPPRPEVRHTLHAPSVPIQPQSSQPDKAVPPHQEKVPPAKTKVAIYEAFRETPVDGKIPVSARLFFYSNGRLIGDFFFADGRHHRVSGSYLVAGNTLTVEYGNTKKSFGGKLISVEGHKKYRWELNGVNWILYRK
jgi:hypothetical protein